MAFPNYYVGAIFIFTAENVETFATGHFDFPIFRVPPFLVLAAMTAPKMDIGAVFTDLATTDIQAFPERNQFCILQQVRCP